MIELINGDCLEMLEQIPDNSVDLLLTDPPYSSGGLFAGQRKASTGSKYFDDKYSGAALCPDFTGDNRDQLSFIYWETFWISKVMQKMKSGAIACIFTDWRQLAATITHCSVADLFSGELLCGTRETAEIFRIVSAMTVNILYGVRRVNVLQNQRKE